MSDDDWEDAPEGEILVPGACGELDADGQGCARGLFHPLSSHQHTGLRAWLESSAGRAVIRMYDLDQADDLEAMETPLFQGFGYAPIARGELEQTKQGGVDHLSVLMHQSDGLAAVGPGERVTFGVRAVCYARPS